MDRAIIISATLKYDDLRYGSVLHHALHLGKHGAVFWHLNPLTNTKPTPQFEYTDITKAYVYVSSLQKVLYVCEINSIGTVNQFDDTSKVVQYVPQWRKKDWKASIKSPWGYWLLITEIRELIKPRNFSEFKRFGTNEPLGSPPRSYSFINDCPEYESV